MKTLFYTLVIILAGCHNEHLKYPEGGYNYIKPVTKEDSNFMYLPARAAMSKKDSFKVALFDPGFYKIFKEPNLSLGPWHTDIFRFYYSGVEDINVMISVTENEITVKLRDTTFAPMFYDRSKLNELETFHLQLLDRNFPLDDTGHKPYKRRYLDSLVSVYPQLLDPGYYAGLYKKIWPYDSVSYNHVIKKIKITGSSFKELVTAINNSGYWKLAFDHQCKGGQLTGASGIGLEANTRTKYHIVTTVACPADTSAFIKACQQLVNLAGMQKEIQLLWD